MSSEYERGNAVTQSVWPRFSIEDSFYSLQNARPHASNKSKEHSRYLDFIYSFTDVIRDVLLTSLPKIAHHTLTALSPYLIKLTIQ